MSGDAGALRRLPAWLDTQLAAAPPGTIVLVGATLVGLVALLDLATGVGISLGVFYLIPVGVVSWYGSRGSAAAMCVVSAAGWIASEDLTGGRAATDATVPWNGLVRLTFYAIVAVLVIAVRDGLARERRLARSDPLTGLANARVMAAALEAEFARTRRTGRPVSLAYLDVDSFKEINDELGHAAGDEVLRTLADEITRRVRTIDLVGRMGGDEFAILLPETHEGAGAHVIGRVGKPFSVKSDGVTREVTISVGIATFTEPPANADAALRAADAAMYAAKATRRPRGAAG